MPALFLCQRYVPVLVMLICCFGLYAALDYMQLWIICGFRLYAALDYMWFWIICDDELCAAMDCRFVRGRESKVCGYNDWMICPCVKDHKKLRIEGLWAVD